VDAETGRTTTFREMREKSIKCAMFMRAFGIKKGDVIMICTCNDMEAYIPYLACLYIGAIADLWHEDYMKGKLVANLSFLKFKLSMKYNILSPKSRI